MSHLMSQDEELQWANLDMPPVKKEKLKKKLKKELREKLRADLPVLTANEIRRYRLPYHEALLAELVEGGYDNSAEFVKQLFHFQEKTRRKFGPGTTIWMRPQLITSKRELEHLSRGLSRAEKAHQEGEVLTEWNEIVSLSVHFAFGVDDWWWLGEQLLFQCVSMHYPEEFKKQETMANYIIGKYLIDNGKNVETGKYYLDLARTMSSGKSWNCKKILMTKEDTVFTESCKLLFKVLIEEAQWLLEVDPAKTVDICVLARKRAVEACDHMGEFQALITKGKAELKLNKPSEAMATITKTLNRSIRQKYTVGICEAIISLALANLQHGKVKESFDLMQKLKKMGEENNLPFYVAQSYRFMGEYYLNQKMPYEATPLLMLAFYIFHETNDIVRREKVRTWAAISAGEELFVAYLRLIRRCDGSGSPQSQESLKQLIEWLDERKFFWKQDSKFSFSYASLKQTVSEEVGSTSMSSSQSSRGSTTLSSLGLF